MKRILNFPSLVIQLRQLTRAGVFDRHIAQQVNLQIAVACGNVQLDCDPPHDQLFVTVPNSHLLFKDHSRADAADLPAFSQQFTLETAVLTNHEVAQLFRDSQQKLDNAEV